MADLKNATTYRDNTRWSNGRFRWKDVPSSSDPHDQNIKIDRELFWIAERSRGNGGGQPEDVPRRWRDIQGDERRALEPIYKAFMDGYDAPANGTPLTDWIDSPLIEPLVRAGIRTVEDLANSPQNVIAGCGIGCLALQKRALEHVAKSETTKAVSAELAVANAKIEELTRQIAALAQAPKRAYNKKPKEAQPEAA